MGKNETITVIDYGGGNLRSVVNAIAKVGYEPRVTSDPAEVSGSRVVILPGVGAAGDVMASLTRLGLADVIRQRVKADLPLLGICIGLQVLFTGTEEGGWHACLGIIPGKVQRLPAGLKIPHMGWNQVKQKQSHPIFEGIPDQANFYFVHSYYGEPEDRAVAIGETGYSISFTSAIAKGNMVATQFHPEKSGELGLRIYSNFIKMAQSKFN